MLLVPELPTGPISGMVRGLQRMVAASMAFQRHLNVSDEVAARKKVFLFSFETRPEDVKAQRPFALIWPLTMTWSSLAGGSRTFCEMGRSGSLTLIFTDNIPAAGDTTETEVDYAFAAWLDQVIVEIARQAGRDDKLWITSIAGQAPLIRRSAAKDDPAGAYVWAEFAVTWVDPGGGQ